MLEKIKSTNEDATKRFDYLLSIVRYRETIERGFCGLNDATEIINLVPLRYGLDYSDDSSKELIEKFDSICGYYNPEGSIDRLAEPIKKEDTKVSDLIATLALLDQNELSPKEKNKVDSIVLKITNELAGQDLAKAFN